MLLPLTETPSTGHLARPVRGTQRFAYDGGNEEAESRRRFAAGGLQYYDITDAPDGQPLAVHLTPSGEAGREDRGQPATYSQCTQMSFPSGDGIFAA